MKRFLFLMIGIITSASSFSQSSKVVKKIPFEGVLKSVNAWDGTTSIEVKVSKGPLAGKTELFYFTAYMNDNKQVQCKGKDALDWDGSSVGKRIRGTIIESTCKFESMDDEDNDSDKPQKCYRPIEIILF